MFSVSENKVLTHPSSVDSISTSAAQEDHVSMGGFAARKAIRFAASVRTYILGAQFDTVELLSKVTPKRGNLSNKPYFSNNFLA